MVYTIPVKPIKSRQPKLNEREFNGYTNYIRTISELQLGEKTSW